MKGRPRRRLTGGVRTISAIYFAITATVVSRTTLVGFLFADLHGLAASTGVPRRRTDA